MSDDRPQRINAGDIPVLIAGAGIGGLTAALCLARRGYRVDVFEKAASIGEVGAGIQLSPNCTRVLHELGLQPALAKVAFVPQYTQLRDWRRGTVVAQSALGQEAVRRYGFPYYHVHRADLIQVLSQAAAGNNAITVHTDAPVTQVQHGATYVELIAAGRHYRGALLVGADGIHSTVRASLFGAQEPTFTGNVAWRCTVPAHRLPANLVRPASTVWLGPGKHFVHYYVRGGGLVNCVCVVEKTGWELESWTERGERAELAGDFAGWHPNVQTLIGAMDEDACYKWALFDRPPLPCWSVGRATLLGDACHPTLPFMAQGAAMAIEDAAVLAGVLADEVDGDRAIANAVRRYELLRRPRTSRIQAGSRRNAKIFHLSGTMAWLRNRAAGAARQSAFKWVYSYDALQAGRSAP